MHAVESSCVRSGMKLDMVSVQVNDAIETGTVVVQRDMRAAFELPLFEARLSARGDRLAYLDPARIEVDEHSRLDESSAFHAIAIVDVESSQPRTIRTVGAVTTVPEWFLDGKRMLLCRFEHTLRERNVVEPRSDIAPMLYVIDVESDDETCLGSRYKGAVSTSGFTIVAQVDRTHVVVQAVDGSRRTVLEPPGMIERRTVGSTTSFSCTTEFQRAELNRDPSSALDVAECGNGR